MTHPPTSISSMIMSGMGWVVLTLTS